MQCNPTASEFYLNFKDFRPLMSTVFPGLKLLSCELDFVRSLTAELIDMGIHNKRDKNLR